MNGERIRCDFVEFTLNSITFTSNLVISNYYILTIGNCSYKSKVFFKRTIPMSEMKRMGEEMMSSEIFLANF